MSFLVYRDLKQRTIIVIYFIYVTKKDRYKFIIYIYIFSLNSGRQTNKKKCLIKGGALK